MKGWGVSHSIIANCECIILKHDKAFIYERTM